MENQPINQEFHESKHGRTMWDMMAGTAQSKILLYSIITIIFLIIIYFMWDIITLIPLYAISSFALSLFWYNPITNWLSRGSTFIEVWDSDTNTLTTYRAGKDAFSQLERKGITNTISSLAGSNRIFANSLDLNTGQIETTFVHKLDPWTYHKERRTLTKLSNKLSQVLDDIIDNESTSQVEGRFHAMESLQRHYQQLDKVFFGDLEPQQTPTESNSQPEVQTP